ncbi:hypothetical protein ACFYRN_36750 [Streptomyces sp. NPDC005227]|uniref:hypothetical protein n=1 Tax=unclassified Streptomyces TaxID=2593676 RepID=UPI0036A14E87
MDRKQKPHLNDQTLIPGTHEIWAVGAAGLEAHGAADFQRPVVSRRSLPHRP